MQLVATGNINHILNLNNMTEDYIPVRINGDIGFNKILHFDVERHADVMKKLIFNIKMNAAPRGYHYKQAWYNHFFKKITLEIGGQTIFSLNSNILRINHLSCGEHGVNELTFNYPNIQERMEKSRIQHEVIVEPFKLSELIHGGIIRLISLAFHTVRFTIETSSLIDILEQDETDDIQPPIEEPLNTFIQSLEPSILYQYLDTEPRRAMSGTQHEDVIKQHIYDKFEVSAHERFNYRLHNIDNFCSAMYIHITDRNNKEIPQQIVSNIRIRLNNHDRFNLSGFHCRHINKEHMPHPTIDNNKSQNLYYISYFTERNPVNGAENGVNLARIDNYDCVIDWVNNIQMDVNVHIVHRTINTLRTQSGMAGLRYTHDFGIRQQPNLAPEIIFENTEQIIHIPHNEVCMFTQDTFTEGTQIDYCTGCKKGFTTEMLKEWMARRNDKKCVHCARPYNATTFKRGKVHLIDVIPENTQREQIIVNDVVIPTNTERQQLIVNTREEIRNNRNNFLTRLFG